MRLASPEPLRERTDCRAKDQPRDERLAEGRPQPASRQVPANWPWVEQPPSPRGREGPLRYESNREDGTRSQPNSTNRSYSREPTRSTRRVRDTYALRSRSQTLQGEFAQDQSSANNSQNWL